MNYLDVSMILCYDIIVICRKWRWVDGKANPMQENLF